MIRYLLVLLLAACGTGAESVPEALAPPPTVAPVDTSADSTMARDTARGG